MRVMSVMRVWLALLALPLFPVGSARALPWPTGGKAPASTGLQASVQRWKSMEQCLEELAAQLPTEAASQVLGNDPMEVICASRHAAAKDDPEICRRDVKDYNQRGQCLRFFAIYTGRPQDCPQKGWPSYHEGLCTALAGRQPSLCLAVPEAQRPVCRAVLLGDSHCGSLAPARRPGCRREAAAWRGLLKPQKATLPSSFRPSLEVRATALGNLSLPAGAGQFRSTSLDTGLLLAEQAGSGDWLCIDRNFAPQESYEYRTAPPLDLELQAPLPSSGTGTVTIGSGSAQAKVSFREAGSYRYRTLQATSGSIVLTKLERSAAGQVAGTFSLELTDGVDRLKLDGEFLTFVRDLLPLATVSSYMRYRTGSGGSSSYYSRGSLSPEEVQRYQSRILKVKEGLYDVDTSVREDILANTSKLTDSAHTGQDYSTKAVRLYSVQRNGLLGLLGFQDNDIIRKINGKSVISREDYFDAFARLRKAPSILVLVERGGTETKLTYRIKKVAVRPAK